MDKTTSLTPLARRIICDKATEFPHTGIYNQVPAHGTYLCRRCGLALFRAHSQFSSGCGWPSFDDEIPDAITRNQDEDGLRTEIVCSRCQGHLGHVFSGESLTSKNLRHCVNSASIDFVVDDKVLDTEEVIVAGGCFWGVDHLLKQLPGVLKVEVGYCGGQILEPTYVQVCSGTSGHLEAVRVVFDVSKTTSQAIYKRFFEIHDPTQASGQGPDLGSQYQSAVFYYNDIQLKEVEFLITILKHRGYKVVTKILPMATFWPAEAYHQDYYLVHNKAPYCHRRELRFGDE